MKNEAILPAVLGLALGVLYCAAGLILAAIFMVHYEFRNKFKNAAD